MLPTRRPLTLLVILALAVVLAACGQNDDQPGGGGGASDVPATGGVGAETGAPGSPAGDLSGDLTIWAMGNEGELLGTMADLFMEENPNVNVEVTPIAWDQAVTRLQTAIGGGQTPDVSQMGTDMMGQFVATGAIEPVGSNFEQAAFWASVALEHHRVDPLQRPVLPLGHRLEDPVGDPGDRLFGHLGPVDLGQVG